MHRTESEGVEGWRGGATLLAVACLAACATPPAGIEPCSGPSAIEASAPGAVICYVLRSPFDRYGQTLLAVDLTSGDGGGEPGGAHRLPRRGSGHLGGWPPLDHPPDDAAPSGARTSARD